MVEAAYRLLGLLLLARRALVAVGAVCGVALWYALVGLAVREPTAAAVLSVLALPLLLGFAAWRLFLLPPGVVFRPLSTRAAVAPQRTARCRASAYFAGSSRTAWRLLARASLAFDATGALHLVSPPPLQAAPDAARQAFPTRGQPSAEQLRSGERTPYPEWVYQPETLVGASRLVYNSAADYERAVARLAVARAALVDVRAGWQYAALHRWPAVRLTYAGTDGALTAAYLAFADVALRDWALAELVGRESKPQTDV
ncbi:MAG TPA: hypothetical protein VFE37_07270 [Chloroflexota bacterium]|nr:hypothetical protein [Chloroflexota bacterium]